MKDVMLDLETLGVSAGCAILSIGAVAFDEFDVAEDGFYCVVSRAGCKSLGLREDASTVKWWEGQNEQARLVLDEAATPHKCMSVATAIDEFRAFLSAYDGPRIWGNGADFDLPILNAVVVASGRDKPIWMPYNGRCYRTVKNQFKDVKLVRGGTYHNALDDARAQAEHLVQICKTRGWKLA